MLKLSAKIRQLFDIRKKKIYFVGYLLILLHFTNSYCP